MLLRIATQLDLSQLLVIEELTQFAPWNAETFQRCWEMGYESWVVEHEGKVAGFIVTSGQLGECHILNLCVHPNFQHQGFGRVLVENSLTLAKIGGAEIAFLEVRRSNTNAISLYQKLGFVEIGQRKGYYPAKQGREDALVFAKDLRVQ